LTPHGLALLSRDPAIDVGGGEGTADDPVRSGGSRGVVSMEGDVVDTTYPLPASGWSYRRSEGVATGYVFHGSGVIRLVRLLAGDKIRMRGRGRGGHTRRA